MQNLTRNMILLTASLLLVAPAASAQGIIDLSATADVEVAADASAAFDAVERARAEADAARAQLEAQANAARAEAQARGEAALEQTQAHAEAGAQASVSFGERAIAELQQAIEAVKGLAAKLSAKASLDVEGSIDG